MPFLFDRRASIPSQVMARLVGNETVVLDLVSGTYYGLDGVGSRIWTLIAAGQTFAELCGQLEAEYDVPPEQLRADVESLVEELTQRRLLALS